MNWYDRHIMPRVVNIACSAKPNRRQRQKVVPRARGVVLEVGIGSGLNLPYYDKGRVQMLYGLDPSPEMWAVAKSKRTEYKIEIDFEFVEAFSDNIPLDSQSVDTVLTTYTLCTIGNIEQSFSELRRVLKDSGELIFCEHGKAPDRSVERLQNFFNPTWRWLGGGCNLNRDIPKMIESGGFKPNDTETMYIPGWKPACFNYWGSASKA